MRTITISGGHVDDPKFIERFIKIIRKKPVMVWISCRVPRDSAYTALFANGLSPAPTHAYVFWNHRIPIRSCWHIWIPRTRYEKKP